MLKKRGRKRLSDLEFRVLDEQESAKLRDRNNATLQQVMGKAFSKPQQTAIHQPYQLPPENFAQTQPYMHPGAYQPRMDFQPSFSRQPIPGQPYQAPIRPDYSQQYQEPDRYRQQIEQQSRHMQYTKERIEAAIKEYDRLLLNYANSGFTFKVKTYLEKMPEISKKLKCLELESYVFHGILSDIAKTLMLDEFEILNWIKFVERFEFKHESFAMDLFFIALATKLLLNSRKTKEPFEVYLSKTNPQFYYFNFWVTANNGKFYQDKHDSLILHKLFIKMEKHLNLKH